MARVAQDRPHIPVALNRYFNDNLDMTYRTSRTLALIIVCGLGFLVYSNTLHGSFHWDDNPSIVKNFSLRTLPQLTPIFKFWPTRFFTYLTFAFDYRVHQLHVYGYHLVNLIVHICSAALAWRLVLLLFAAPSMKNQKIAGCKDLIAVCVGAVFVAHPVQTQAVTYIAQRPASLGTMLYLACLVMYIKSRLPAKEARAAWPRRLYYAGSLAALVLAMFTKEMTITLPLMILLCEAYFFPDARPRPWKRLAPFFLGLFIIPVTMAMTGSVDFARATRLSEPLTPISPWHYLLTQLKVVLLYIRLLFLPVNQNLDYDFPVAQSLADPTVLLAGFALVGILILALKMRSRYRLAAFGILWMFIALTPESSIVPIKDVVAEHRLYLPMVGYSIFMVSSVYYAFVDRNIRFATMVLALVVSWYAVLAYSRNFIWKNELTLWSDVVSKSPRKARPYYNRGLAYQNRGTRELAMSDFNRALELKPDLYQAYNNRGIIYFDRNERDRSLSDFDTALRINPRYAESYNNRGALYASDGNFDRALADFNQAITIDPAYIDAYANRAALYFKRHEYDKSRQDVRTVEKLGGELKRSFLEQLQAVSGR